MTRSNAGIKTGKIGELSGGQNGDIPYQAGPDTTEFANGVGLVYSNGFGAPTISDTIPASVNFPNAVAGTATNLAGGTSGQIPYQSGTGSTSFVTGPGLVYANASGQPTVSDTISATMSLPNTTVLKSNNIVGGLNGDIPYQSAPDSTSFVSGPGLVYANASGQPTVSDTISATMSLPNTTVLKSNNIVGGLNGDIPYQSAPDSTSFVSGPGLVYANGSGAPTVSNLITASLQLPNTLSGYASSLDGGVSGAIPYQTATAATSFVTGPGLVYANASGQPTVSDTISATMSLPNTTVGKSNNLVGSTTNTIPYQSGTDTTSFLPTTRGILTRFVNDGLPVFQDVITFTPTVAKSTFSGGGSLLTSFNYIVQEGVRQRVNGFDMIMISIQGTPTLSGGGIGIQIELNINFNRSCFLDGIEFGVNAYPGIILNGRATMGSNIMNVYTSNLSLFTITNGTSYSMTFYVCGYNLIV